MDKPKYIDIVFDGPPGSEPGRFVEVEDPAGAGMKVGEWVEREDGYWVLRIAREVPQGVLSFRYGEYQQYFEEQPEGDYVYAVALVATPMPPEPTSEKAEGLSVACAGKSGKDGTWGYLAIEKDTKQLIGAFLHDELKAEPGKWYWLRLADHPVSSAQKED